MLFLLVLFLISGFSLLGLAMIVEGISEDTIGKVLIFMVLVIFGPIVILQLGYEKLLKLFKGGKSAK